MPALLFRRKARPPARTAAELAAIRLSRSRYSDEPVQFKSGAIRWIFRLYRERLTTSGRWFMWVTVAFTLYGASTLDIQAYVPFCYISALWFVAGIVAGFSRLRVGLRVSSADRVSVGEVLPLDVEVTQLGPRGVSDLQVVPYRLPYSIASTVDSFPVPALNKGESARVRVGVRCSRRGVFVLHGFQVHSSFPFGIMLTRRLFLEDRLVMVYPGFTPLRNIAIRSGRRYHAGGVALASTIGDSFEYVGNREFREGDNIRDVDWRSTARLGKPVVREYREEYYLRVVVILDTFVPRDATPERAQALERSISICAAVCDYMQRLDYIVEMFAAGPNMYQLTAGRSLAYLEQILEILSCVKENPEEPFTGIESQIQEQLTRLTSIICIFMDWDETRRDLVSRYREYGITMKVIIVRDGPCTLDPEAEAIGEPVRIVTAAEFAAGVDEL